MNQQLLDFIKKQMESGQTREDITNVLISRGGWTKDEVSAAFASFASPVSAGVAQVLQSTPPPPPEPKPTQMYVAPHPLAPANPGVYTPTTKKGLRRSTTILLIVFFIVLAVGAAWAFYSYFPNLIKPNPEEAIARSVQTLIQSPTVHASGTLQAVGTFESAGAVGTGTPTSIQGDYEIVVGIESNIDRTAAVDPKVSLTLSPDVSVKIPPVTFAASAVLDTRTLNRIVYVQLRSITDILFPIDIARLRGIWIKLEPGDYTQYPGFSSKQQAAVLKKVYDSGALVVTKEHPIVKENGNKYRHYSFTIDNAKFRALMLSLGALPGAATTTASLAALPSPVGEIWISASDYFPHKLMLTYKLDAAQTEISGNDALVTGDVSMNLNFSKVARQASLTTPSDTTSFVDVVNLLTRPQSGTSTASSSRPQ